MHEDPAPVDPLADPLADLPWQPLPKQATVVHVANVLRPREHKLTLLDRRYRLGVWLRRSGHDIVARRTICSINGEWMPRDQWTRYRPRRGDQIVLIDNPHGNGDGSNPVAAVMMIAAIYFMPAGVAFLGSMGITNAGVAQALYLLGANLLISALAPPAKALAASNAAEMAAPSPTYSLSGQGNSNRLGSPRPRHYGLFRFAPAYCAQPYGEFSANEQYLYEILDVGLGHYRIDGITIEDTDIAAFEDIDYEVVPPGGAVTLVPANVQSSGEVAGQELVQGAWVGGGVGFVAVLADTSATEIGVDIVCPYGLYLLNDSGGFETLSVHVRLQAIALDAIGAPVGDWFVLGDITHAASTNTAQRVSKRWPVAAGRYAVRGTRIDAKNTSNRAGHEVTWAGLRAYLPTPLSFPDNTVIAIRSKASGQLTQASSRKVFVRGMGMVPTWSPANGWSAPVATRAIAWAAADILMADYGRGAAAASIDLDKLYQLDQVWEARGDRFDASFDTRSTVAEALTACLKAGRAQWFQVAGMFSFARDEWQSVPSTTFTPGNIVRGSVEVEYVMPGDKTSDFVRAKYWDTTVFGWREVDCKIDGSTSTKPASVSYFGIGDRQHVWREGVTDAAENVYRRRVLTFQSELEGRLLLPLDTIAISHHLVNRSQTGEVVAIGADDGNGGMPVGTTLTLSTDVEFVPGNDHYLVMGTLTGGRSGPWRVSAGVQPNVVRLDEPVAGFQPYVGGGKRRSRFSFGIGSEVYLIGKVVPPLKPKGSKVEIKMVIDDPRVHSADQVNTVPPPAVGWGLPRASARPVLKSIFVAQNGDPDAPVISVSWAAVDGASFYVVEWSDDGEVWKRAAGDTTGTNITFSPPAGPLHVRACAVGKVAGPWATWDGIAGEVPAPGAPVNVVLVEPWLGSRARWKWQAATRARYYDLEVVAASVVVRSARTNNLYFDYDAEDIIADGGPWRSLTLRVRAGGPLGVSDWVTSPAVNPQIGALSAIRLSSGHLQIIASYALPTDTDFAGVIMAMSRTSGFNPALLANQAYKGYDQVIVLTEGPGSEPFVNGDVWYVRMAGFDKFGADELQWSVEHSLTIRAITADPDSMLDEINGLLTDGSGSHKFEILADRFAIKAPTGDKFPFALVDKGGGDYQALLNADVLIGGNVDIANLKTGTLPSDVMMRLGGGTIELDGAGEIRVYRNTEVNADFVRLSAGEIRFIRYMDGAFRSYNYLSRLESGIAANGDTVVIPGYWLAEPRVMVSPASLALFKASAKDQDQSIECSAINLTETAPGSGRWQFTARANLNIAAGSGISAINASSGDLTASTTWTSGTYATPGNCTAITPTVSLSSIRWTGSGATYRRRQVNWRVRYTGDGGGGAWRTKDIGPVITAVTDSYTFNFPSAGAYSFWIEFSASDASGTFSAPEGAVGTTTVTLTSTKNHQSGNSIIRTMPTYTPPDGWTVTSVQWSYSVIWSLLPGQSVIFPTFVASFQDYNTHQAGPLTFSTGSYNSEGLVLTRSYEEIYAIFTLGTAVLTIGQYLGYTTSGQNRFDVASYGYTVAGASVLAAGTLNWMATGR
ncbi:host specificity factor TipJ family phage tail protein [Rhodocyclus tenuis]|nr:host specificity factor TipJ family phage tail protein [Rhodocyclus tenuis]